MAAQYAHSELQRACQEGTALLEKLNSVCKRKYGSCGPLSSFYVGNCKAVIFSWSSKGGAQMGLAGCWWAAAQLPHFHQVVCFIALKHPRLAWSGVYQSNGRGTAPHQPVHPARPRRAALRCNCCTSNSRALQQSLRAGCSKCLCALLPCRPGSGLPRRPCFCAGQARPDHAQRAGALVGAAVPLGVSEVH